MIDAIRNSGAMGPLPPHASGKKLTQEQASQVQSILSGYDAKSLTAADALEIDKAFKEAGIEPGEGLAAVMEENGFDARAIGDLIASSQNRGMNPPMQPQGGRLNAESLQTLYNILDQYDLSNMSEQDEASLYQALRESGLFKPGTIIDGTA
jgi:hypothetical protein